MSSLSNRNANNTRSVTYRKRKTLIKKYILPLLWIAAIIIKIKAETITKIVTKITKTLAVIKYIDN